MSKLLFINALTEHYTYLFENDLNYLVVASKYTPLDYAIKTVEGLIANTVCKEGKGVKSTCKQLKIKNTYKAIQEFLSQ